jgi:energy-converting hydrogenase Eha subunit B
MAAPPAYNWNYTWDFSNGTQGWNLAGSGYWTDPGWVPAAGPNIADGQPSGGGNANLLLPDGSTAKLDVSSYNLGNGLNGNGWVYQADVYIPNLYPLQPAYAGAPGNWNIKAGIQAFRDVTGKAIYFEGDQGFASVAKIRDSTWDNTDRIAKKTNTDTSQSDISLWWDKTITLTIDYGYTTPGKWSAYAYVPWTSPNYPTAGWITVASNLTCSPDAKWTTLQLGGASSWTQSQFDNAKLAIRPVPEPSSLLALGSGLFGLAGLAIRRRR